MKFVHLHTHSHFSLLDGLSKIDDLLKRVKDLGMEAIALTDHGNMYGAIEFYTKAKALGIKPIIGCEVYVAKRTRFDRDPKLDADYYHLILLAKNQAGYKNLLQIVTEAQLNGFYYKPKIDKDFLKSHSEGLIALSACLKGEISQSILKNNSTKTKKVLEEYLNIFGKENFYLELQDHSDMEEQKTVNENLIKLAKEFNLKYVVTADSHYVVKENKPAHEVLLAVNTGTSVDDEEKLSMQDINLSLKSPEEIYQNFKDYPEALENSWEIAQKINLEIELKRIILPTFKTPDGMNSFVYLKQLASETFPKHYSSDNEMARKRLETELAVIEKTGFADYFLVVQDIINFAKNNRILTNTRGSAAGSLVSYILGITNVEPLKFGLFFERFLNPERIEPPDIDIDVADDRRNEVINYIKEQYGEEHVAQIITFGIMKARLAVRDVTRALGLPYSTGDQIAKLIPFNKTIGESLNLSDELKKLYNSDDTVKKIIDMAKQLEFVARHASTHAAGLVITKEPLTNYLPLQHSSRNQSEIITQYSMYDIAKIGLLKMDILGLANLSTIRNALRIIKKVYGGELNFDNLTHDDPKVFNTMAKGETVGIFQLESSGMTHYVKKLKPDRLEDIIALIALYRPGPLDAGMVDEYIARKNGERKIDYIHPRLEKILKETYGIIVYQEQLMQVATELCGFTNPQADTLRKAVGKKIKSLLDKQKELFISKAKENNVSDKIAQRVWEFIEPFARYGFNKSHAASYAQVVYQTAYLKTYWPLAFMSALMTADLGDLDRLFIEIKECQRLGIKVLPPNVNESLSQFTAIPETNSIRFGLAAIKNVGLVAAETIAQERIDNGPYQDLNDFINRLPKNILNKKIIESLIKAGAMDVFANRWDLIGNLDEILKFIETIHSRKRSVHQIGLFLDSETEHRIQLKTEQINNSPIEHLFWEKELLGLYITHHPLEYADTKDTGGFTDINSAITNLAHNSSVRIKALISKIKRITTRTGKPMLFTQVEDRSKSIELVVFPSILERTPLVWKENSIVVIEGKIQKQPELKIIVENASEIKI